MKGQRHVAWYLSLEPWLAGSGRMLTMTGVPGGSSCAASREMQEARGWAAPPPVHTWFR